MTLVRSKRREAELEGLQEQQKAVSRVLKYVFAGFLFAGLILSAYQFNLRTAEMSRQIEMYQENLSNLRQHSEVLDMQIAKIVLGRDVIN
ncbi:hypothetical protein [Fervidobacterium islandicum]|uniref:hypothetical protein n=1 Tax=Fervidobacterium islandicum TaxID=2423 RepID=UPI003A63BC10